MQWLSAITVLLVLLSAYWLSIPDTNPEPPAPKRLNPDTTLAGIPPEKTGNHAQLSRQAILQQADSLITASQAKAAMASANRADWFARLTENQRSEYRRFCLDTDMHEIRDVTAEHLGYHEKVQLETWEQEIPLLQAMQAQCDLLREFIPQLQAEQAANPDIDPDTGVGNLYLDLRAIEEESGAEAALSLAIKHLMDTSPQRRANARQYLLESPAVLSLFSRIMPDSPSFSRLQNELDLTEQDHEHLRQMLEPVFAVADCEAGYRVCGPGSFWALQQCRDFPRSCGMPPYEALHYMTPPFLMTFYQRLLTAMRQQSASEQTAPSH